MFLKYKGKKQVEYSTIDCCDDPRCNHIKKKEKEDHDTESRGN